MDKNRPLNSLRRWRNCFCAGFRNSSAKTLLAQNNDPAGYEGYRLKNTHEKQKLMVKTLSY